CQPQMVSFMPLVLLAAAGAAAGAPAAGLAGTAVGAAAGCAQAASSTRPAPRPMWRKNSRRVGCITCAPFLPFDTACRETSDNPFLGDDIDQRRWQRAQQCCRHHGTPREGIPSDQADQANGERLLRIAADEHERV